MGCRFSHILFFKPFLSIGLWADHCNTIPPRCLMFLHLLSWSLYFLGCWGKGYGMSAVAAADDNSDLFVFVIPLQSKHFLLSFI
jgi:hypothetical protein